MTIILVALAGAIDAIRPVLAVPSPAIALVLGFLGVTGADRAAKFAATAKIPGERP
jgi:hypothetical protein